MNQKPEPKRQQAVDYLATNGTDVRVCVPAYERIKQLYAFGHTNAKILDIVNSEFSDIDYNSFSLQSLKKLINNNLQEFEQARMELGMQCREEIQRSIAQLFLATGDVECVMVDVFVKKMRAALDELMDLDMQEKDDDGNFKNTSRTFVLIEIVERLQKSVAKVVGTDALREVEAFRQKAMIKAQIAEENDGLLPATGRSFDSTPTTKFI